MYGSIPPPGINNTISGFKAAKESIFNVALAFYIKNSKKQYQLWVVKVKFHVFTCYKNMKRTVQSIIFAPINLILAHIR